MALSYPSLQKVMIATYTWLRITLSYCVVGAVITTLISAYLQNAHLLVITLIMAIFLCLGVYNAELTRRYIGLNSYFEMLSKHKYRDL